MAKLKGKRICFYLFAHQPKSLEMDCTARCLGTGCLCAYTDACRGGMGWRICLKFFQMICDKISRVAKTSHS